jgi:cell wall-associated NlpC family hydrolase
MANWLDVARQQLGQPYEQLNAAAFVANVLNQTGNKPGTGLLFSSDMSELVQQMQQLEQVAFVEPGDVLFWGVADAPYHVAIYLGGYQVIGATQQGDVARIQTIHDNWLPTIVGKI